MTNLSQSCSKALKWLKEHNGTGSFEKYPRHHVLIAGGEEAPVMRITWNKLQDLGLVEIKDGRVTVIKDALVK
jgi:hypothetical protein